MKKLQLILFCLIFVFSSSLLIGQEKINVSGEHTLGAGNIILDVNSAKFNKYSDLRSGFMMPQLNLNLSQSKSWFMDIKGLNLLRDDQTIEVKLSDYGNNWNISLFNSKNPRRLSNGAYTVYNYDNGWFRVPQTAAILRDNNDATGTPSLVPTNAQMAINDAILAEFVKTNLNHIVLAVQRDLFGITLDFPRIGKFSANLTYTDERRNGNKVTYGPIGDRPPRTLNLQMPEPVDYVTREIQADVEYNSDIFQAKLTYLLSMFQNRIPGIRWQNVFFRPHSTDDYISAVAGTARNVSLFGQRSLAPDNTFNNISLLWGLNLPLESRLTSAVSLGFMNQDMELLPYSYSSFSGDVNANGDGKSWNDVSKLPTTKANASIKTLRISAEYYINPFAKFNLRPFVNYYDLKNETPILNWRYVTQDVAGTTGDVDYKNYRKNLAYSFNKLSYGANAGYYFSFWRTSLNVKYLHEDINRDYREANTKEDIVEGKIRFRPASMVTVSASYLYGSRKGDGYDYKVTKNGYWYTFTRGANEVDNPAYLFANHPDLRKYDVSDRIKNVINVSAVIVPAENFDFSVNYNNYSADYNSKVTPVAPLQGTGVIFPTPADEFALTPGQQLGLLKEQGQTISFTASYVPSKSFSVNIFADIDKIVTNNKGMYFNENQRREPSNPGNQPPTALGPWTDPNRIFNSETTQKSNTFGAGISYEFIPGKFRFLTDLNISLTTIDMDYSGYGSDPAYLGRDWETFQFGFNDPPTIKYDQYTLNAGFEYTVFSNLKLGVHYLYSSYTIVDWVDGALGPWVEQVGSENFLRDTSRDNRWGNRLINMGLYPAPSYTAHAGFFTMTYNF